VSKSWIRSGCTARHLGKCTLAGNITQPVLEQIGRERDFLNVMKRRKP